MGRYLSGFLVGGLPLVICLGVPTFDYHIKSNQINYLVRKNTKYKNNRVINFGKTAYHTCDKFAANEIGHVVSVEGLDMPMPKVIRFW